MLRDSRKHQKKRRLVFFFFFFLVLKRPFKAFFLSVSVSHWSFIITSCSLYFILYTQSLKEAKPTRDSYTTCITSDCYTFDSTHKVFFLLQVQLKKINKKAGYVES
ncbi:hypothetical protein BY458DRAFT_18576 [Sporodiniella umbellata]|nr:hypothetical protein BY458DRAFT_18576 [Sporodiniella umbellata]